MSDMDEWNAPIIAEFRANAGRVGGQFEGSALLLLHTTGAKSGAARVNPVMYLEQDDRVFVFASNGGADSNPDWFRNISQDPNVSVEIASEHVPAVARILPEDERARVYAVQAALVPGFAEYQTNTSRLIPVVEIVR